MKRGFTLVEVLVVLGIIGMLLALLFPVIQTCRAAARRTGTMAQLKEVTLASHNHAVVHTRFPGFDGATGWGWSYRLLPYLEQHPLHSQLRHDLSWDSWHNLAVAATHRPRPYATIDVAADNPTPVHSIDDASEFLVPSTSFLMNSYLVGKGIPTSGARLILFQRGSYCAPWSSSPEALELQREPNRNDPVLIAFVDGSVQPLVTTDSLRFRPR
jgi:prepilin-type N-terminal cleavage/methylation domain-containing protein